MKTFRIGVVSKDTGKITVHKETGTSAIVHNNGGYCELRIIKETTGEITARFNGWAWCKEVKTS